MWVIRSLALIFVALLAACDSGDQRLSHEDYQQRIIQILQGSDSREANRLYFDLVANEYSQAECTERARAFHKHLDAIVGDVESLKPPEDAKKAQRQFLEAAKVSVDRVGELARNVESGRLACGRDYNRVGLRPAIDPACAERSRATRSARLLRLRSVTQG